MVLDGEYVFVLWGRSLVYWDLENYDEVLVDIEWVIVFDFLGDLVYVDWVGLYYVMGDYDLVL